MQLMDMHLEKLVVNFEPSMFLDFRDIESHIF